MASVQYGSQAPITDDIPVNHNFFRTRQSGVVTKFLDDHKLEEGSLIKIERLAPYTSTDFTGISSESTNPSRRVFLRLQSRQSKPKGCINVAEENEIDLENPAIKAAIATAVEASVTGLKTKNTELLGKLKDTSTKLAQFETPV